MESGLLVSLRRYDFAATGGGGDRGETVECRNGQTLITVSADWLEGELSLTVQRPGEAPVPIGDLIDLTRIKGLHLSRLGRNVSVDTVTETLRKVGVALDEQAGSALGRSV